MTLTADQVLSLAPDAAAAAAGRKLAAPRAWQGLGRSDAAVWGECQGSALYQVRADLADLACRCTCPSRKLPCKHALGLLLLAADGQDAVPQAEPPPWVSDWLAKRTDTAQVRPTRQEQAAPLPGTAVQSKRAERRLALVGDGLDGLDLWLADLVRNGLAGLELQPASFWEKQAARLVDAQAPGLAARVRRLAAIPNASPRWPERLLGALGRLALLGEAFRRLDSLDPALQSDVRGLIGWTLKEEEVLAHGDLVRDHWQVIGQWVEDEDRGRVQRTWLLGTRSGREALILQFSFAGAPFAPSAIPGTVVDATLAFWPSAYPQRALIHARHGAPTPLAAALQDSASGWDEAAPASAGPTPGTPPSAQPCPAPASPISSLLAAVATALARQPWLERFPCLLRDVVPVPAPVEDAAWQIRDGAADALPLIGGDHWQLLALSGGHPLDLAAEWDGLALRPLGAVADGIYHHLWEAR